MASNGAGVGVQIERRESATWVGTALLSAGRGAIQVWKSLQVGAPYADGVVAHEVRGAGRELCVATHTHIGHVM